jgi:hypothetical protein
LLTVVLAILPLGLTFPVTFDLAVAFSLTVAVELFLFFPDLVDLALRLGQNPRVMLGVLGKVLGIHTITRQLRIAMQLGVFLDDLGRGAPDFSIRTGTVKDPIDDIAACGADVAVLVAPRP